MTAEHTVEWFIDRDTVYGKLTCTAPEGANCRLVCDHGCERWSCEHALIDAGHCNAVEWIENVGAVEESYGGDDMRPLKDGPIEFQWTDDGPLWTYGARCADGSLVHDFKGGTSCPACGWTG